jgi:sortase A
VAAGVSPHPGILIGHRAIMKVSIRISSPRSLLKWTQRALLTAAALMLGYCGFVLLDRWIFQLRATQTLEHPQTDQPASDSLFGRIEIPRLGLSVAVAEGTDDATLRRAVGHVSGTASPGQPGNIGIAAHRDTFFRPLRNIRRHDIVTLTTLRGEYRYQVLSTKIVAPDDVGVLNSDGNEILTLVTCYPFYFIGSAPKRFIVRAARVL